MTKLVYPSNGICPQCKSNLNDCKNDLSSAANYAIFDVPEDFPYKEFLDNLHTLLTNLSTGCENLKNKLKAIDTCYETLSETFETNTSRLTTTKITKNSPRVKITD
ncbi:hypothetical protein IKE98_00825 [Candidatus Saccharibacteria bacterium]|nr:hypothetical protein [Candidatus Saccharibacteria bacterium]